MNRRLFAGTVVAATLSLSVVRASAQKSTPDATPEAESPNKIPLSSQPGFIKAVVRSFQVEDPEFEDLFGGKLFGVSGTGAEFDTPEHASETLALIAEVAPEKLYLGLDGAIDSESVEIEGFDVGDESLALSISVFFPEGDVFQELLIGMAMVRKEQFLQIVIGYSLEEAAEQSIALVEVLDDRWPSDDLWEMAPTASDVAENMSLDEEKELLPGE